jgi:hypothetical protein
MTTRPRRPESKSGEAGDSGQAIDLSPMERFKLLARQLLGVPRAELEAERQRHEDAKSVAASRVSRG